MYGNNDVCQRGQSTVRGLAVTGDPLGKYTDNSANLIQQGFQRIKDRFKLLHSARKILKGERTASCFIVVLIKRMALVFY